MSPSKTTTLSTLLLCLLLAGCEPVASSKPAGVAVSVDAVNYMHDWDVQYTLTDLRTNEPVGGAIVGVLEGPGGKGCCVTLPERWQPGIKLRVTWEEGNKDMTKPEKYQRDLELPRYEAPGDVYVLFYPAQQVEVRVSAVEPGQPGWAGRVKLPAWPACVQRLGEKTCRKMMPKYAIGSMESTLARYRKACQEDAMVSEEQKSLNGTGWTKEDCQKMHEQCMALETWEIDKRMCDITFNEDSAK